MLNHNTCFFEILDAKIQNELVSAANTFTEYRILLNPLHHDPGRREKINIKFLFPHFFEVPQKVL